MEMQLYIHGPKSRNTVTESGTSVVPAQPCYYHLINQSNKLHETQVVTLLEAGTYSAKVTCVLLIEDVT